MVKIIIISILLFFTPWIHAGSSLTLSIESDTVEIGKPLLVTVAATNINTKLSDINLNTLEHGFGVEVRESSIREDGITTTQLLTIALYPRYIGDIYLPELLLSNHKTKAIKITVKAAKNVMGNISFSSSFSSSNVWQRQQIVLSATITSPSRFSKIELDDYSDRRFESVTVNIKTKELENGLYEHKAGWKLYPLISGDLLLNPPAINYMLNGVIQRKFFPAINNINVKKLPSYIPPLMPVGTLTPISTVKKIESNSHSHIWVVQVETNNIMPSTLRSLTMPIDNVRNIKHGEIKYSKLDSGLRMSMPISFRNNGFFTFPEITYKAFNPESGKITTTITQPVSIVVLNVWIKTIISLLFLYVAILLCYLLYKYTRKIYITNKRRQAIIKSCLTAETPCQLRSILNDYANNQGWSSNMTLKQWLHVWESHSGKKANRIINTLSFACYGNNSGKILQNKLNGEIYKLLTN